MAYSDIIEKLTAPIIIDESMTETLLSHGFYKLKYPLTDGFHFFKGLKNLHELIGFDKFNPDDAEDKDVFNEQYPEENIKGHKAALIAKSIVRNLCDADVLDEYDYTSSENPLLQKSKYFPFVERWVYLPKDTEIISPLAIHQDDYGAVNYETISVIFYLQKDKTIKGGRLFFHKNQYSKPFKTIDVESDSVIVMYGNLSHSIESSSGTGIRDCLVVQLARP